MKNPFSKKISDEHFELSMKRYDAFFKGEVYDRPPVSFTFRKENSEAVKPEGKTHVTLKDRWMDYEQGAKWQNYNIDCTEYYADALPTAYPNLGPEIFSAICGCDYNFGPGTTWTSPNIIDWEKDMDKAVMNRSSEYFIAVENYTKELLKYSKDKFAVGFTDLHPGADHLAALRDPEVLCMDLYDYPEFVKTKLAASYKEYFEFYDYFYNMITGSGSSPCVTGWLNLVVNGRYHVVGNDFSYMISTKMYEEFFLDGLIEECNQLDKSIYHLDGPGALAHLDAILGIKKLNAVQWVSGEGNGGFSSWIDVFKRIQKAGKGMQIGISIGELDKVFANLKPDGIWFSGIWGVNSKEEADKVLERIKNWK